MSVPLTIFAWGISSLIFSIVAHGVTPSGARSTPCSPVMAMVMSCLPVSDASSWSRWPIASPQRHTVGRRSRSQKGAAMPQ
jgi:hypothetical protein